MDVTIGRALGDRGGKLDLGNAALAAREIFRHEDGMTSRIIFNLEERILSWETRRRGQRRVPKVGRDDGNVLDLGELRVLAHAVDAVSFDVFDTLLHRRRMGLRAVQRKTAVWGAAMVGGSNATACQNVLFGCRGFYSGAMKRAMIAREIGDEPLLTDLFEHALRPFEANPIQRARIAQRMVDFETETELRNLEAGKGVAELLVDLRAMGKRIVATSDMYLPGDSVRKILDHAGLLPLVDRVFVSSEERFTKARGILFGIVAQELGLPPDRILHVGDNWEIDKVMAQKQGLRSKHYFNREEEVRRAALNIAFDYNALPLVRRSRIRQSFGIVRNRSPKALDEIIDGLIGPGFALAVHRMLSYIAREKIEKVFFVTRDGTLLGEIAEAICASIPVIDRGQVAFSTLAMSRIAGALLEFERPDDPEWLVFQTRYNSNGKFSLALLLELFNIDLEPLLAEVPKLRERILEIIHLQDENVFLQMLENHPHFRKALGNALLERRTLLEAYLKQEGVIGSQKVALVDIGYSGTLGKSLSHTLARMEFAEGAAMPRIDLLLLATNRFMHMNLHSFHPAIRIPPGFLINHERQSSKAMMLNSAWLEPFTADLCLGKLKGYRRSEHGQVEPVFAEPTASDSERETNLRVRALIVGRAARFADDFLTHDADEDEIGAVILDRLARFVIYPTRAEVKAMQELRHQEGMNFVKSRSLTRPIRLLSLPTELSALRREDYWVQGSFVQSRLGIVNHLWHRCDTRDRPRPLRRLT